MRIKRRTLVLGTTVVAGLANMALGGWISNIYVTGAGACALVFVGLRLRHRNEQPRRDAKPVVKAMARPVPAATRFPARPDDPASLVRQMLAQRRYAILLRPQLAAGLDEPLFAGALEELRKSMALVPDGEVVLGRLDDALDDGRLEDEEIASHRGRVVAVDRFFLDRYQVTNREFFEFVAGGCYEQASLWDESVLPAVLDFVDRSGRPGPRYWKDGSYAEGEDDHPVVGVSWHEALAYARWVGKRLPTDAEWVKAAAWPVKVSATVRMQRKYPWGEVMDRQRANIWGQGPGTTVPVGQCAEGVSVGGVCQLIGNVWEWTSANLRLDEHPEGTLVPDTPMKSIRGGAFDTYFDNQATCQFQSGEPMLGRKHNIGFRCAVGVCDLMLSQAAPSADADQSEDTPVEEVPV